MERMRDRARMLTFARFVGRRFIDDRLFEAAGALAFTTAFAIVPLSFVVFGVLSAFPGFEPVSSHSVGQLFVKSVLGVQTGRVFDLDRP